MMVSSKLQNIAAIWPMLVCKYSRLNFITFNILEIAFPPRNRHYGSSVAVHCSFDEEEPEVNPLTKTILYMLKKTLFISSVINELEIAGRRGLIGGILYISIILLFPHLN